MKSNIITLTTDWGDVDNYAAIFKAHLYREIPDARIVDVTHRLRKHAIADAAFLVKTMYHYYPKNSVHIIDVNSISMNNGSIYRNELKKKGKIQELSFTHHLAFYYDGHYFLCANNGIIALFCDIDKIEKIVKIPLCEDYAQFNSFKAIPYFVRTAVNLTKGTKLDAIGQTYDFDHIEQLKTPVAYIPPQKENQIICMAQYIDSFGNIITNLHKDLFDTVAKGRGVFTISSQTLNIKQKCRLSNDYNDSNLSPLALFGQHNYLELSTPYASMGNLLKGGLMKIQFILDFSENNE